MTERKTKPKEIKVWVAVDPGGFPGPWTTSRTRRDCKKALIHDWLGEDLYESCGDRYRIVRAKLVLLPSRKGKEK
jgi:hypothetical protein